MRLSIAGRALRRIETTSTRSFTTAPRQIHSPHTRSQNNSQALYSQSHPGISKYNHNSQSQSQSQSRTLHTTTSLSKTKRSSLAHNNEPIPDKPPTTDFSQMDMLGQTPIPSTSIEVCNPDGFQFNSGVIIEHSGAILCGGEAFSWRPWGSFSPKSLINAKGQFEIPAQALGVLSLVWPRPDLLIIGMGSEIRPLAPETKKLISGLGMRVDVMDTRNASSQFNLLATERGVDEVAALLVPLGFRG